MQEPKSDNSAPAKGVRVQLVWKESPEDLIRTHADEMAVSYLGERVYITFGELVPPALSALGTPTGEIRIQPVAQVVLTDKALAKFRELLNNMAADMSAAKTEGDRP